MRVILENESSIRQSERGFVPRRDYRKKAFGAEKKFRLRKEGRRRYVYKAPSFFIVFGSLVNLESCCYNQTFHV